MASSINASITSSGIVQTADASGILQLQSNGATLLKSAYTLSGANITISSAPANGSSLEVTTVGLTTGGGGGGGPAANVFYENDQTLSANYTISSGKNAMSTGPITIANGVSVTVPSGSKWVVL